MKEMIDRAQREMDDCKRTLIILDAHAKKLTEMRDDALKRIGGYEAHIRMLKGLEA